MFQNLQNTIKDSIQLEGVGLHNGIKVNLCLKPAEADTGILFKRIDVDSDKSIIEASYKNVSSSLLCTKIKNLHEVSVSTIEHLMAAFYGEGVDNVVAEIDAPEVPIMDGSAFDFVEAIRSVGIQEQKQQVAKNHVFEIFWCFTHLYKSFTYLRCALFLKKKQVFRKG